MTTVSATNVKHVVPRYIARAIEIATRVLTLVARVDIVEALLAPYDIDVFEVEGEVGQTVKITKYMSTGVFTFNVATGEVTHNKQPIGRFGVDDSENICFESHNSKYISGMIVG